jgi:hypothetical protein
MAHKTLLLIFYSVHERFSEVDIMPENLNESDKDDQIRKEYSQ